MSAVILTGEMKNDPEPKNQCEGGWIGIISNQAAGVTAHSTDL
jgi:hypothetical protein